MAESMIKSMVNSASPMTVSPWILHKSALRGPLPIAAKGVDVSVAIASKVDRLMLKRQLPLHQVCPVVN